MKKISIDFTYLDIQKTILVKPNIEIIRSARNHKSQEGRGRRIRERSGGLGLGLGFDDYDRQMGKKGECPFQEIFTCCFFIVWS